MSFLLSRFWFAARVGAWLCALPLLLRIRTLPLLLHELDSSGRRTRTPDPRELDRVVWLVSRVCRVRLFELPVFPRPCLRRALALYSVLTRLGYPVEIHFGVRRTGPELRGHSWVTLDGVPLRERSSGEAFQTIYAYRHTAPH